MINSTQAKPVQHRNMAPSRISRALRPLREAYEEASKSKTLSKGIHDQVDSAIKGLVSYTTYQEEKEKSGEEMLPEAIRRSAEEASELHKMLVNMSKTKGLEKFSELIQPSNEIVHRLKQLATRLEKRDPKPAVAASKPEEPRTIKADSPIRLIQKGEDIQIGNFIMDKNMALAFLNQHVS